jgi:DNA-binding MarR family transcriptional regulator
MTRTLAPGALAAELRVAVGRSARRIRAERSDLDLSDTQLSVLFVLEREGPTTPGELADHEHVQPPTMTRVVNCLADRGLVERSDHPSDRRQVLVAITDAGRHEIRETRRRRDAWLAGRLAGLTPDERAVLAAASTLLGRIAAS